MMLHILVVFCILLFSTGAASVPDPSGVTSAVRCDDLPMCHRFSPFVCGSDGKTYRNECELAKANCRSGGHVTVVKRRPCQTLIDHFRPKPDCPQYCIAVYDPVCGTDGHTYSNSCRLYVHNCNTGQSIGVAYKGACGSIM